MIKINTKKDPLLAKDFPSDPYSNLNIITSTQTFNLQQAFLAMDSQYFAKLDPEIQQVDLSELKQEPLQKVLRSLYGEQLHADSISELLQLYSIISFLEIQDYKKNIVQQVQDRNDILQSLQFLELSFKQKICWEKVLELHIEGKLKMLEDSKNYLQLSKIGNQTFDLLLTIFLKRYGESENKILNNVMQNYFNRKSIKPMTYLKNPALSKLQAVWLKYHHVSITELNRQIVPNLNSSPSVYLDQVSPRFQKQPLFLKSNEYEQSVENKRKRVIELQKEIKYKDNIISELNQQIDQIKRQLGLKPEITKPATVKSLLIEADSGQKERGTKKKRLEDLLGERNKDSQSVIGQHNKYETKQKQPEVNQIKPLHRLGSKNMKKL